MEQHTTDEPVSVVVTVTPAPLVVMTVRQGTVVLLLPDTRTSPVTVKTFPAGSVVVISVVGIGEGVVETIAAEELPVAASVVACVNSELLVTTAFAQNSMPHATSSKRIRC